MRLMQHLWSSLLRSEIRKIIPLHLRVRPPAYLRPMSSQFKQRRPVNGPGTNPFVLKERFAMLPTLLPHNSRSGLKPQATEPFN
jgi:hypothetical protein